MVSFAAPLSIAVGVSMLSSEVKSLAVALCSHCGEVRCSSSASLLGEGWWLYFRYVNQWLSWAFVVVIAILQL